VVFRDFSPRSPIPKSPSFFSPRSFSPRSSSFYSPSPIPPSPIPSLGSGSPSDGGGGGFGGIGKIYFKGRKFGNSEVFVLPDLLSVSITEQRSYAKYGGGEAVAPRVTKDIYNKSLSAFKGFGIGRIPSEQMRTGKYKITRLKI